MKELRINKEFHLIALRLDSNHPYKCYTEEEYQHCQHSHTSSAMSNTVHTYICSNRPPML
jgi:hypothetical protein